MRMAMASRLVVIVGMCLFLGATALALGNQDVVGQWSLDQAKSASAPDGNTAGLMKDVAVKADGSFEALYGTKGTWKLKDGKLLVTYPNSGRGEEEATMDGALLKFPAPAMKGKFCYLKKK